MNNNSSREMSYHFGDNGYFKFKLDNVTQPVYFNLSFKGDRYKSIRVKPILHMYIAEPGDSIVMFNLGKTTEVSFYGRGVAKYQCRSELDKKTAFINFLPYISSDSFGQLPILESYKKRMSLQAYHIMKADIVGQYLLDHYRKNIYKQFGNSDVGMRYDPILKKYDTSRLSGDKLKQYKDMSSHIPSINIDPKDLALSMFYTNFLVQKTIIDDRFLDGNLSEVYYNIKRNYKGELRDQLLTSYLSDNLSRLGDGDVGTKLLTDALSIVKIPYCQIQLNELLSKGGKGMPAYNFSLPDVKGNIIKLTDFKGKIVFMDFWYTGCSNCVHYYEDVLSKVETLFKNNPSVVFITINIDKSKEDWLKALRGELIYRYTSSDAINLNTGVEGQDAPIFKFYNIQGCPRPLLIDKQGKIFSNSYGELRGGGVEKLVETINRALAKPD